MHIFALDDEVASLEKALLPLRGAERLAVLVPLAWHLRQRDTKRALALADAACALLPDSNLDAAGRERVETRMALVRAEAMWLGGALHEALGHAQAVLRRFGALLDHAGCADTHWLLAWIAVDLGEHGAGDAAFAASAEAARLAGDSLRVQLAQAAIARWSVLRDSKLAVARWGGQFNDESARLHRSLETWNCDFLALAATFAADYGVAAGYFMRCYESALATGQLRAAITATMNIRETFMLLDEHASALEWAQRGLELARPNGWAYTVGGCLTHTSDTLRRLGQLDAAHEMLHEALQILKPLKNARSYATALQYLGDLSLDRGDYVAALDAFTRLEARADALDQSDFRSVAWRGQAHALSHLERPAEALAVAGSAVATAASQAHAHYHLAALRVMAAIHARHALPPPQDMAAPNPALHYLHQALALCSTIDGYAAPFELYDAMAHEYAAVKDYPRAYDMALSARAAREKTHSRETTNRAIAMQVLHQTEQARSEGSHHRQLAESEARRAEVLQRTSATLERLSVIGQEITTHLDAPAVFGALERHLHGLLSATAFAIYLVDSSGTMLERSFGAELGQAQAGSIALSDSHAYPVRCLALRREIYLDGSEGNDQGMAGPGMLEHISALFAPLLVGERVIGVMTVQAPRARAYGENERMVFRTLCAYGAIALDNAHAYLQLKDAQTQLLSQEKLAALGALVAGVAHELNTPIGNSLLIASTIDEKTAQVEALMNGPGLRRSQLAAFIDDSRKASTLVMRGLTSAADLVNSFKQVALDRTTEQRRRFDLQQVCREIVATMMNRIRGASHGIELLVDAGIEMDSYPGPFGQVVTNFINNALLHAFDGDAKGNLVLAASKTRDGRVTVEFRDNGCGIRSEHLGRIFDPFFTTKLGQGGSGLGLAISHNIVSALLGGQIAVTSSERDGTCFTLDLPLTAPQHDPGGATSIYPHFTKGHAKPL